MPKRSPDRPNLMSKYEKVRQDRGYYDGMVKKPSKINPIFLKVPDYGIKKGAVK